MIHCPPITSVLWHDHLTFLGFLCNQTKHIQDRERHERKLGGSTFWFDLGLWPRRDEMQRESWGGVGGSYFGLVMKRKLNVYIYFKCWLKSWFNRFQIFKIKIEPNHIFFFRFCNWLIQFFLFSYFNFFLI
jgi:hypothetical protein